ARGPARRPRQERLVAEDLVEAGRHQHPPGPGLEQGLVAALEDAAALLVAQLEALELEQLEEDLGLAQSGALGDALEPGLAEHVAQGFPASGVGHELLQGDARRPTEEGDDEVRIEDPPLVVDVAHGYASREG